MKIKIYHIKNIRVKKCEKCGRNYLPVKREGTECSLCFYGVENMIDTRMFNYWDWINN